MLPIGLFLGGVLADYVFEPFMAAHSPVRELLSVLIGTGKGSGITFFSLLALLELLQAFYV